VAEPHHELLNVYDGEGRVLGVRGREEAKRSGLAVGAVNVLLVDAQGRVLLQRRRADKENGGRWDKTVGGHVDAGEGFDAAAVRETGEELFGDGRSPHVKLVEPAEFAAAVALADLRSEAVLRHEALRLNLRDVRVAPDGSTRNVVYHVSSYLGRSDVPLEAFRPQHDEIAGLRWASAAEVDGLLLRGELSPNMAYLWLTHALVLLSLPGVSPAQP
jgi:8-oxo-dGTP pyrophosphatase MutT (NUDIX family)